MLIGTTRQPRKEVMKKMREISEQLGNRSMVIIPSLLYTNDEKRKQFEATAQAYGQGGVKVERAIELGELNDIATQDDPPMVILAGGCPYTLIEQIRETQTFGSIHTLARKSLVAGACAGAMAIAGGSQIAAYFNTTTDNYDQVDREKVEALPGVRLVSAQVLPISDKLGSYRPRSIALKAYIERYPFEPIYMLDGGSGFYCTQSGSDQSVEPLGKTEILVASQATLDQLCGRGYSVLERDGRPLIADKSSGMI